VTSFIFAISILSGSLIVILSILSLMSKNIQFWPPPKKNSWQYLTFWLLFRLMIVGLFVLCVVDFNSLKLYSKLNYVLGIPLTLIGFGIAIYSTSNLGWKNAHGEDIALKTTGLYQWSRNPIYIFSILGMLGVGLIVNSLYVYIILFLWASMYVVAPFLEESWLEKHYGKSFMVYKSKVPRFIGFRKR